MKTIHELNLIRKRQKKIIKGILKMSDKIEVVEHQIRLLEHMDYPTLVNKYMEDIYSKHRVIDKLFTMLEKTNKENQNLFN